MALGAMGSLGSGRHGREPHCSPYLTDEASASSGAAFAGAQTRVGRATRPTQSQSREKVLADLPVTVMTHGYRSRLRGDGEQHQAEDPPRRRNTPALGWVWARAPPGEGPPGMGTGLPPGVPHPAALGREARWESADSVPRRLHCKLYIIPPTILPVSLSLPQHTI